MHSFIADLRFALRSFARTPAVSLLAVATLALGIGANAAIFSVIHGVLIAPLPYPHADRVVVPWRHNAKMGLSVTPSLADLDRWKQVPAVESMTMYRTESMVLTGGQEPEELQVCRIAPDMLDFTGTRPVLGRAFTPGDAASDAAARVILLTDGLWRRRFGAASDVVGRRIQLSDQTFEIAGVLPPSFALPMGKVDIVAPLPPPLPPVKGQNTFVPSPSALVRLKPGVSVAAAEAQMAGAGTEPMIGTGPAWTAKLIRPVDMPGDTFRRAMFVLFGAVGFVLLIACANVANIILARNAGREREIAVRVALGAGRRRLIQQLLTENLLLALVGGVTGMAIGAWGVDAIIALRPPEMTQLEHVRLSREMFAFGFAISLATGLLFGLLPAIVGTRANLSSGLKQGGRTLGGARGAFARRTLSIVEIALALVLLAGAGLLIRSYARLQRADLGFNPEHLLAVEVNLPEARYPTPASRVDFVTRFASQVRQLPSVKSATLASGLPPRTGLLFGKLEIEGRPPAETERATAFGGGWISPGYFEALHIPILEGRGFTDDDARQGGTIIVNRKVARDYWPGQSALGKKIRLSPRGPFEEIVGVVGDVKTTAGFVGGLQMYEPLDTRSMFPNVSLLVSTTMEPSAIAGVIKGQAWSIDPKLPVEKIDRLEDRVAETLARPRFNLVLLSVFAAIGLLLAAIGIYGVISYSVGQRSREIGVRMALGALPSDIRRAILGEAMMMAGIGTGAGLAGALLLTRLLSSLLFEVSARDPWTLGVVAMVLAGSAVLAAWMPARRAMHVDPMTALRME